MKAASVHPIEGKGFIWLGMLFILSPLTEAFPDKCVSRNCDLSYVSIYTFFFFFLTFDPPSPDMTKYGYG